MRFSLVSILSVAVLAAACNSTHSKNSTSRNVVSVDPDARQALFSAVKSLEGQWEGEAPDGSPGYSSIQVSSGGSAVRELMLEGTPSEMTNMYTLDGNDLVMTHYCAAGNQPRMRAQGLDGNRIVFQFEEVADLKSEDEVYMGEMTLVLLDNDRIEQHWRAFKGDEIENEMTIAMKRVR